MKTYTICGSMKFEKEMQDIAFYLETERGFNILQCIYTPDNSVLDHDTLAQLTAAHYRKIDISDGIYVLNMNGYIGESVTAEIAYAKAHNKEILYYC